MAKRRRPTTPLAVRLAVFKAHRWLHHAIHKCCIILMFLGLVAWFFFPHLASVWVVSIAMSLLVCVVKSRFQPRIVQMVNAFKNHGPYRGHGWQGRNYDMPKLYIAETGIDGKDGRPILGLNAREDIPSGRCIVKSFIHFLFSERFLTVRPLL